MLASSRASHNVVVVFCLRLGFVRCFPKGKLILDVGNPSTPYCLLLIDCTSGKPHIPANDEGLFLATFSRQPSSKTWCLVVVVHRTAEYHKLRSDPRFSILSNQPHPSATAMALPGINAKYNTRVCVCVCGGVKYAPIYITPINVTNGGKVRWG